MQQQRRRVGPVHGDQVVVIGPADAGAVQQQVELGEGGDGGRAVGEHLHVARGLFLVAVLEMPAGGDERAGGDGIAQPRLLHCRPRPPPRDRAARCCRPPRGRRRGRSSRVVALAEHGAPRHGDPHAGVQRTRRQLRLAERRPGQPAGPAHLSRPDRQRAAVHLENTSDAWPYM